MLDLEPRLWRKGLRENFEDQRKKVLHFAQKWKLYDFTKSKEWKYTADADILDPEKLMNPHNLQNSFCGRTPAENNKYVL